MEQGLDEDRFTFSKLNHIKIGKSGQSTRPQNVNQEHKFNFDMSKASSFYIKEEKKQAQSCKDRIIIRQGNKYKAVFDMWLGFLYAYSCVTAAYFAAYEDPSPTLEVIDLSLELFFWIDIFLNFFQEFQDPKTHEVVCDLKKIAFHYVFKSTFIFDFLATFPFYTIFKGETILTRFFRLVRLPRLLRMLEFNKFLKLVTTASIITYFFGCIWYLLSELSDDISNHDAFYEDERYTTRKAIERCIISAYYMLTTLSTVGYGDFFPLTNIERVICVVVMLFGVAFFSYIMGRFIEIIEGFNSEKKTGTENDESDLKNWFTLLAKFKKNKVLSKRLTKKIQHYFEYYWENDRLAAIKADNEYMKALPRSIKMIMINYLFGDVLFMFRQFFRTVDNLDSKFLSDLCLGFQPRKFEAGEIIYEEEEEAPEVYFIMSGTVSVG
jgi:hypothetical protein